MTANQDNRAGDDSDSVEIRVRRRLRELRLHQGLTLDDVASAAQIDVSTLSRLESGKRRLALDHLPRLARALSVSTDELLQPAEPPDPRVHGTPFTRDGVTFWPLSRRGSADGLHTFKLRISEDRHTPPAELPVHDGQEWLYVLSGTIRLILGEREFLITPGEAVEFTTKAPHWFGAANGPAEAIVVLGARGEQLHLHS